VPKWKLSPRIEPPEIPRWQLETLAQERAAELDAGKHKNKPDNAQQNSTQTQEEMRSPSLLGSGGKPDGTETSSTLAEEINYSPDWKSDAPTRNLALEQNFSIERECSIVRTASKDCIKARRRKQKRWEKGDIFDSSCCDDGLSIASFVKSSETLSFLFNKLGCFGVVDAIFEPSNDFDETFTLCSETDESDEAESLQESYSTRGTHLVGMTSTDYTEREDNARRGLGELEPMLSTLESYKRFLEKGESEPIQLEFISNLLTGMEDKLEVYTGYRRRGRRGGHRGKATLQAVSRQVDEVSKLILRTVEDFIDEKLLQAMHLEEESISTSSWTMEDTVNSITTDGEYGADHARIENNSLALSQALSFDRNSKAPSADRSPFSSSVSVKASPAPSDDQDHLGTVTSSHLEAGATQKFLSSNRGISLDPPESTTKETIANDITDDPSNIIAGGERDDKSEQSSNSNTSRTTLVKNLTKVLSLSPMRNRNKSPMSPGSLRDRAQGVARLDKALFIPSQDDVKPGYRLPPLKPRYQKPPQQIAEHSSHLFAGIKASSSWGNGGIGFKTKMKRRNSEGSDTLVLLQEAYEEDDSMSGIEAVRDSLESGTSLVNNMDEDCMIMVQETFDGDNILLGVESVVGIAGAPLGKLPVD